MIHMVETGVYGFCSFNDAEKLLKVVRVVSPVRMSSLVSYPDWRHTATAAVQDALRTQFKDAELHFNLEVLEPDVKIKDLYPCREIERRSFKRLALSMKMDQLRLSLSGGSAAREDKDRYRDDLNNLRTIRGHLAACRKCDASMKLGLRNDRGILSFNETITL